MKKIIATLGLLLLGWGTLWSVTPHEGCPDFTDLTASYVEPFASGVGNQLVEGRHTVITEQGTDPRTGNKLRLIPDGVHKVVRLGDELAGSQSESLTYHFKPTLDASMINLKFAVVFENPNHGLREQPYFSISVTDKNGHLLPNTFQYAVYADNGLSGFKEYVDGNTTVMWRDWTDVVVDLCSYIGEEVLITFKTRDCLQNGHYAYAYLTTTCASGGYMKLLCLDNNNVNLSMIDGFDSYHWSDGTDSKDFEGILDQPIWCDLTSVIGLITKFFVAIADDATSSMDDVIYDEVCEGEEYSWLGHSIDTKFNGTRKFNGALVEKDSCTITYKTLMLKTIPTRTVLNETICEGEDYFKNGFKFRNPPVGEYMDSIEVESDTDCKRWNILKLRVVSKSISPSMKGDETPCTDALRTYEVSSGYNYNWVLPENAVLLDGGLTEDRIGVKFTDVSNGVISAICSNGCVSKTVSMPISPVKTFRTFTIDTICQGTTYQKNGWNLGVQKKLGYSTFIRQLGDSCNASDVLLLYVMKSPSIGVVTSTDVVCPGEEVRLAAVDKNKYKNDYLAIGDVWCEDGTIMKLKDFLVSGKVAKGIVCDIALEPIVFVISIADENNGDAVPYEIGTMDNNKNLWAYSWLSNLCGKWLVLNKYLGQIGGADLLDGLYWLGNKHDMSLIGLADTHRAAIGYDGVSTNPIETKCKIRYMYFVEVDESSHIGIDRTSELHRTSEF
ncbi:MAG: hypothetical protein J6T28_07790 [Paludibacteraceae bacterium]|nr:hypothetical protein [Paludibacteraceae bacterium]MBP5482474.1 hypothetical protein [Paludibacteraceae bacterium]